MLCDKDLVSCTWTRGRTPWDEKLLLQKFFNVNEGLRRRSFLSGFHRNCNTSCLNFSCFLAYEYTWNDDVAGLDSTPI